MQLSGEIEKSNFLKHIRRERERGIFLKNLSSNILYQCLDINIIQRLLSALRSFRCKK